MALIELNKGGVGVPQGTYYCVLGVPTVTTDLPTGPIVNFTRFAVQGEAYDRRSGTAERYTLERSVVTMTVDISAGVFVSVLRLIGTSSSGATRDLGTYTVQGGLIEATGGLIGSSPVQSSAADLHVSVNGGFFGPQGKEFGYYFTQEAYGTSTPGQIGLIVRGVVSGER